MVWKVDDNLCINKSSTVPFQLADFLAPLHPCPVIVIEENCAILWLKAVIRNPIHRQSTQHKYWRKPHYITLQVMIPDEWKSSGWLNPGLKWFPVLWIVCAFHTLVPEVWVDMLDVNGKMVFLSSQVLTSKVYSLKLHYFVYAFFDVLRKRVWDVGDL